MQVEAETQLSKPQAPGRPTDPDCQADCFRCISIGEPVPVEVKQLIAEVPQSFWMMGGTASYRKCAALHFGVGLVRSSQMSFGEASESLPELQRLLLSHLKTIRPDICFSSFVLNRYSPGNMIGPHSDENLSGHSMQLVLIWGDFQGGDLLVYRKDGAPVPVPKGPVSLLMDGNVRHEVTAVTSGMRYSLVTYAKESVAECPAEIRQSLIQMGFPFPDVGMPGIQSQAATKHGIPESLCRPGQAEHASLCTVLVGWFDRMCEQDRHTIRTAIEDCEFLRRLQAQRDSGDFCDLLISIAPDTQKQFRCHQCVLAAHSECLHRWLLEGLKGCNVQQVSMDSICTQAMGIILDHIYGMDVSEDLRAGTFTCVWDVCKVALAWKVTGLFPICKDTVVPRLGELGTHGLRDVLRFLDLIPNRRLSTKQTQS